MIKIRTTQKRGFWRCGRQFSFGFQEYRENDFTKTELERIKNDPLLVIEPVELKLKPQPGPEPESKPEPEEADLEATLSDGRPRCQFVGDSGKQCRFAAAEGAGFCDDHTFAEPEPED